MLIGLIKILGVILAIDLVLIAYNKYTHYREVKNIQADITKRR